MNEKEKKNLTFPQADDEFLNPCQIGELFSKNLQNIEGMFKQSYIKNKTWWFDQQLWLYYVTGILWHSRSSVCNGAS